jgi:hypothetical protein
METEYKLRDYNNQQFVFRKDGVNYDITLVEGENGYNLQTQNGEIIDTLRSDIQFDEWIQSGHLTMIYDDSYSNVERIQAGGRKKSKKSKKGKKSKKNKKSKKSKKSKKRSNRTRRSRV